MSRLSRYLVLLIAAKAILGQLGAFSLVGPEAAWQTPRLGYALNMPFAGGPMDIGEEYRFNVPVVYYGFTSDFLNYFGQKGVDEIDKAFKILNELPAASKVSLADFPFASRRINHRAAALGLIDLKSTSLSIVLHEMGLGSPIRFVYTLRSRWIGAGGSPTNFYVIRRNFDPETWRATSYINGQLWTYPLVTDVNESESFVFTEPVDPLACCGLLYSPVASMGSAVFVSGSFWTGLTRDDIGGLRYIYRKNNYNVENLPTNTITDGTGGGGGPWGPPPGTTNTVTNAFGSNVVVNIGLRSGREKIKFTKVQNDSTMGFFVPFTNNFADTYYTNGTPFTQFIDRAVTIPDILFDVADLQGGDATDTFTTISYVQAAWSNNDANNGIAGHLGPGVVEPGLTITFNSIGSMFWNVYPNFLSEYNRAGEIGWWWGSFDGTTNDPVVYPLGTEVTELERRVLKGETGSPWRAP
ncbi:MAG: hypothetical protein KJ072_01125 [Verrucomicrobia bacterium]|nr:hypothetical protein [Verrucomicrobiota bacterium]